MPINPQQAKAIFLAAFERPPEERGTFLDELIDSGELGVGKKSQLIFADSRIRPDLFRRDLSMWEFGIDRPGPPCTRQTPRPGYRCGRPALGAFSDDGVGGANRSTPQRRAQRELLASGLKPLIPKLCLGTCARSRSNPPVPLLPLWPTEVGGGKPCFFGHGAGSAVFMVPHLLQNMSRTHPAHRYVPLSARNRFAPPDLLLQGIPSPWRKAARVSRNPRLVLGLGSVSADH